MSRRLWAAPALLWVAATLAACGDMSRFQMANIPSAAPAIKPSHAVVSTPASEKEHERILASYGGVYDDPRLQALVTKTVDRLVAASERPDQAYQVTILNSGAVNAFALPTGQLYVTRGLLALANDTSELSSVLSHEMAHVLAKHAAQREDQVKQAAIVDKVVTDMGNDPEVTAFTIAKNKMALANFSRAQELDADKMGVGISAKAHFDPYGAARFLTSMERNAELKVGKPSLDPRAQDFLSSHPATPERVEKAEAVARQYTKPENSERDREDYLSAIDNIVYGEDPSEGFVRGRRFLHPKLGFTFQAPENFSLDNTAQAVIGVRDGGAQAMRFDVVRVPADQTLSDYLNSGWMENVDKSTTEDLTINGFPAASTTAHGDQWQFKVYALRFGADVYRFIFASRQKTTESERNARETVNSFRRLTLEEIQDARPLRIKVITVQPGDTVESLSHRMAGVDHPVERFRVLNGLDPKAQVKVRDRVKIVVD
ncbi:MAG TPA: M48 family metalloprotease [Bradyrhizobium sp.]|uniref:M48 family metalloprotease n=1 Tax=Bradyrhizobium sp. TaxID=376 RepID=UPI002C11ED13|nr:M48 family metalloprotease [Bradyrhizobium sp.]HLZ03055.1 M48 family metalloprotease [Bradyrhizobium sp.]